MTIAIHEASLTPAHERAVSAATEPAPASGRQVAVIGAGPAGMACAHRLAMLGHGVLLYEARSRERMAAGAPVLAAIEQEQFARLAALGRIRCEHGHKLGDKLDLAELHLRHDALFLGIGLAAARVLGLTGLAPAGLIDAGRHVAAVHASEDLAALPVPQRAVVIGASCDALAMSARLKALGAQDVTLALRHCLAPDGAGMQAARACFVRVRPWLAPLEVLRDERGAVEGVRFEQTRMLDGRLVQTGGFTELAAHAVFKAVGRAQLAGDAEVRRLSREGDRIQVDECFRTALPGVYAGGDCVLSRIALEAALRHGDSAARAIHADLQA